MANIEEVDRLSKATVIYFEAKRQSIDLLHWAVKFEVLANSKLILNQPADLHQ